MNKRKYKKFVKKFYKKSYYNVRLRKIINIINNIENYIPTPKKYRNVYLTFKKWAEKEYGESNNNITTKTIVYD